MNKKLLQIELNEFSFKLMHDYANKYNLVNINYFLGLHHIKTYTNEKVEHRDLDPWIQWVSVHTGMALSEHNVRYLGSVHSTTRLNQIWDRLSKSEITSGLWSLMNSKYHEDKNILFFLADPWSSNGYVKPHNLEDMVGLPTYYARNYSNLSITMLTLKTIKLLRFIKREKLFLSIASFYSIFLHALLHIRHISIILFALFDLISTLVFCAYKRKFDPDYSVIFINCVAHMQHHCWVQKPGWNINLFVFRVVDKIFSLLKAVVKDNEALILINGFTQEYESNDYYCYRQIDPYKFIKNTNIQFNSIQQGMTNDSLIKFDSPVQMEEMRELLSEAIMNGVKIFYVDIYDSDKLILFYRIDIKDKVFNNANFIFGNKILRFYDEFKLITNRTGSHISDGDIFCKNIEIADRIKNDQINNAIISYYNNAN